MLGAKAPAFETYGKGAGVERIEGWHAINNDEPMNVELQLHQQLFAKGVDEVGGVGSPRTWRISARARATSAKSTSCNWVSKLGNSYWTARNASSICPVRKSSVHRCASLMVSMPSVRFSVLCCPNRVGHSCPAPSDRLWLPGGAFADRLMFHLRIELGAD
jgi:hypothetical protein